ncbi:MAG: PAS domain S-box protein, partial [Dehalococcoidia bacterium]|nr:PAS domain S-box protein [Dehalococcoidia bacterium]
MNILVVDDSAENRRVLERLFKAGGHKVSSAANGEEALVQLRAIPGDLIVSDILMPVMDGFRFLQQCKNDKKLKNIPFIFLTGTYLDKKDEELSLKLGADAFIRKPVEPEELFRIVDEVTAAKPARKKLGIKLKSGDGKKVVELYKVSLTQKLEKKMHDLEQEIAERRHAQEALKQSEEQFRLLFETMAQGVVYQDADGKIISANPAALRILGLTQDQIMGRTSYDPHWKAMHEDGSDFPGETHPSMVALKTGKPVKDVVMGIFDPMDSQTRWININATPLFKARASGPHQVYTTFNDITDRILSERALQESNANISAILENTQDFIWSMDREHHLLQANSAARKWYPQFVQAELVEGMDMLEPMHQERRAFWEGIIARCLAGEQFKFEQRYDHANNSYYIEFSINPIVSPESEITGLSFRGSDITQRRKADEALRQSEEKYRTILDEMDEAYYEIDSKGNYTFFNDATTRQLGYTRDEFMGLNYKAYIPREDWRKVVETYSNVFKTGKPYLRNPQINLRKDGTPVYLEDSIFPIRNEKGEIVGLRGIARDVTERKKTEEELRKRALLLDSTLDSIIAFDESGNVVYANESTLRTAGFSYDEMLGKNIRQLVPAENVKLTEDRLRLILETGELNFETTHVARDGSAITLDARVRVAEIEGRKILVAVYRDNVLRKQMENALKQNVLFLQNLIDSIPTPVYYKDVSGKYVGCNRAFADYLGYPIEEIMGKTARDLHPKDLADKQLEMDETLFNKTGAQVYEAKVRFADGSFHDVVFNKATYQDTEGRVAGLIGVMLDITDRKTAEEELILRARLLDTATDSIFMHDFEGNFIYVNETAYKSHGYTREELMQMNLHQLDVPEYARLIEPRIKSLLETGYAIFEAAHYRKDGSIVPVEVHSNIIEFSGRKYILSAARDITQRKKDQAALIDREQRFRSLFENNPVAIFVQDKASNYIDVNAAGCALLGYSREEIIGISPQKIILPEKLENARRNFRKALRGESVTYETTTVRKDGERLELNVTFIPLIVDGKIVGVYNVVEDISASRKAEEALMQSEEKYRSVVENALEIIFIVQDGVIKFINRRSGIMLGYTPEEAYSHSFTDFIHPDDRQMVADRHARRLHGEELEDVYSFRVIGRERNEAWVELRSVLVDWEGKPATLNFLSDITGRKRAEEALRRSEERYRTILDEMGEGYYEIDAKGNMVFINEAEARLYGYAREDMLGMNYKNFTPRELWSAQVATYVDVFRTGIPKRLHPVIALKKDGTNIYLEDSIFPIRDEKGEMVGLRGIARDVTERKKSEEDLKKALDTINITLEGTIEAIAMMSELRDPYTAGHQRMVTELALAIADEVGLPHNHKQGLRVAGLLHDIGKVHVPSEILSKPGKLSALEMGLAKSHAEAGYEIVKAIKFPWPVCRIIVQHHERIDGSGYPHGLKRDEITLEARILAVADVVEAMMSHRPYRPALGPEKALDEITKNRGILYDEK